MKTLLIIAIVFICGSCDGHKITPVITTKYYENAWNKPLQPCICRFWYKSYSNGNEHEFQDSCHLYKVGDNIYFKTE